MRPILQSLAILVVIGLVRCTTDVKKTTTTTTTTLAPTTTSKPVIEATAAHTSAVTTEAPVAEKKIILAASKDITVPEEQLPIKAKNKDIIDQHRVNLLFYTLNDYMVCKGEKNGNCAKRFIRDYEKVTGQKPDFLLKTHRMNKMHRHDGPHAGRFGRKDMFSHRKIPFWARHRDIALRRHHPEPEPRPPHRPEEPRRM